MPAAAFFPTTASSAYLLTLRMTAQIDLDWDKDPPPQASSLDRKYMLTVGYSW